jgi:hypothetical protein
VPGKPVIDQQVRAYMQDRHRHTQGAAAARAGFSERTARRIDADPRLPSQRQPERGRTVPDPLEAVWEPLLLPILEREPAVQAVTLLRHLQMTDPDAFPDDRVRRTLERRVRDWRALHGAARDVIFCQTPEPGRMALSDFTDATELGTTSGLARQSTGKAGLHPNIRDEGPGPLPPQPIRSGRLCSDARHRGRRSRSRWLRAP